MDINTIKALLIEGVQGGIKPNEVSSLALAYIGDAIYEIFVRTMVLSKGNAPVNKLHKQSKEYVNAKGQAELYQVIAEYLTEEEKAVFRRGRNAKSYTTPKNMDIADYRCATGLEALFGYLYLKGDMQRALELFEKGVSLGRE
mgnify:CR=1 FL=1